MLLSDNNIKSELSYAYLHAIAARAGFACEVTGRHSDGAGVDAVLRAKERFFPDSVYTNFTAEVQLKSTSREPVDEKDHYSFAMSVRHYDKARSMETAAPVIVVVLFLPEDAADWLIHSEDSLITRRCAYWVSLYGAPPSANATAQTVYVPKSNCLSVDALRALMGRFSRQERLRYASP